MKTKLTFVLLMVFLLFIFPHPVLAQGGCLASSPAAAGKFEVLQAIELAPEIVENQVPFNGSQKIFYQNRVKVPALEPGWQLILARDPCGESFRSDDQVRLVASTGQVWEHDFRHQGVIVEFGPVVVTGLAETGMEAWVEIFLIDILPPRRSSSSYVLLVVNPISPDFSLPTARLISLATATPVPTETLFPIQIPAATAAPTAVKTPPLALVVTSPTSNPPLGTEVAMVADLEITEEIDETEVRVSNSGWGLLWWLIGAVLLGSVGLWVYGSQLRTVPPPGGWEIYFQDQYQRTIEFASLKKNRVRAGSNSKGEVVLEGEDIPPLAVQVVSQIREQGRRQAVYEILDSEDPEYVVERYVLEHGDEHVLGDYKLVYFTYQAEESFYEGSDDDD